MAGRKVAKECGGSGGVDFVRVSEAQPSSEALAGKLPTLIEDVIAEFGLVGEVDDHSWWLLSGWQAIAMAVLTTNRSTGRAKRPPADRAAKLGRVRRKNVKEEVFSPPRRQDAKRAKLKKWEIELAGFESGVDGSLFGISLVGLASWRFKFVPFATACSCNNP